MNFLAWQPPIWEEKNLCWNVSLLSYRRSLRWNKLAAFAFRSSVSNKGIPRSSQRDGSSLRLQNVNI
ncbi:Hypothetical predicted protein [Cloeon dipterum]|uniref:Uncharacterized protein n=1 Tax=Cloeon dipterum TaxID=197152 RepID=A0A8S1E5G3_9INSE|nr:Hypothetical predicted protein [Cloeon dipterum]